MTDYKFVSGLVKDKPDPRDWMYAKVRLPIPLPKRVLWKQVLPVRDQGELPMCVGFAGAQGKEVYTHNRTDERPRYSPRFLYTLCKRYDRLPPGTEGTTMRALAKVMTKHGACLEEKMQYLPAVRELHEPNPAAFADGLKRRIAGYARCQTMQEIKQAIVEEGPLPFGMLITEDFFGAKNGVVPREFSGPLAGGHAMVILGYDDEKEWYIVLNSWGARPPLTDTLGLNYIPYSYMHAVLKDWNIPVLMDAWAILLDVEKDMTPKIELWVGKNTAVVGGKEVILDAPPVLVNGRTMVPLRFVGEAFGREVRWIAQERKVVID